MKDRRMRLTVHARPDGSIRDAVIQPEGDVTAHLVPEPPATPAEVAEHDFHGDFDREELARLRESHEVEVSPAKGRLVRRREGGKTAGD